MAERLRELEAELKNFETKHSPSKSNIQKNLEDPVIRVLLGMLVFALAVLLYQMVVDGVNKRAADDKAAQLEQVELLEERYGVTIERYSVTYLGEWTIGGQDYFCKLLGPVDNHSLSCVSDDFMDFSEIGDK